MVQLSLSNLYPISHKHIEHTCCLAPPSVLAAPVYSTKPLMTGTETDFSSQTMKMETVPLHSYTKWQTQAVLHSPSPNTVLIEAYIQCNAKELD